MQIITSLRLALGLVLAVAACTVALAHDFVVNGIYYERNRDGASVTVTYKGASYDMYDDEYFGDVTIPSRVTYSGKSYTVRSISDYAFAGCTSVRTVSIPHTISSVGKYTFANCIALCKVSINDLEAWCRINFAEGGNPLIYAHHLFLNEREIHHLIIPNTVSQIGQYAFCGCHSIVSAQIGIGVTSIGDYAFAECTGLRLLTALNEVPPTLKFGESTFTSIPSSCVLYVPSQSRAQYRSAYGWRYFSSL